MGNSFGRRVKSTSWLEECWASSIRDLSAGEKEPCSRKLTNSAEEELAP